MNHRLNQYKDRQQLPPGDLRERLNWMREQREHDEQFGIPPSEDSYIHNMPKQQRHAGYPNERNRPEAKIEWDEKKTLNIKVEVSESGERIYRMNKDEALKVTMLEEGPSRGGRHGKPHGSSNIVKDENEPGMKTRGRGRYRGGQRGRGYFRGRGRGGFRGGRKPRQESGAGGDNSETASNASATEQDHREAGTSRGDAEEYYEGEAECDDGSHEEEGYGEEEHTIDKHHEAKITQQVENVKRKGAESYQQASIEEAREIPISKEDNKGSIDKTENEVVETLSRELESKVKIDQKDGSSSEKVVEVCEKSIQKQEETVSEKIS